MPGNYKNRNQMLVMPPAISPTSPPPHGSGGVSGAGDTADDSCIGETRIDGAHQGGDAGDDSGRREGSGKFDVGVA